MATTDALQRKRLRLLFRLFAAILGALVIFRVGYWMIYKSEWLKAKASLQWNLELPVEPQRGNIEDRNGNIIAVSVASDTVVLHPQTIAKYDEDTFNKLVNSLSEILEIDRETIEEKARKTRYSVVWLDRQITQEQVEQIKELNLTGVSFIEDKKRMYPFGNFLTQVLGFTSIDGEGLEGIESRFDQYLKGTPGSIVIETDREGEKLPGTFETYVEAIQGNNIKLTIDLAIQSYAEAAMDLCLQEQQAKSVIAIVMNCNTLEVLAMVNKPGYDNNEPPRYDADLLRSLTSNLSITKAYEPGTIFNLITAASAINNGTVNLDYNNYCEGSISVDGKDIECWAENSHDNVDINDALNQSCNLTFADLALRMGLNDFYKYMYDFGFGQKAGLNGLYGESAGYIMPIKYVLDYDLAKMSYGQSLTATPLQLITAFSALANGGNLMQPFIIKSITTQDGEEIESNNAEIKRTVISYETSSIICDMLYDNVENGNGINAKIDGYDIGGYAGTAQKHDESGYIIENEHVASFVAVAPINNPEIVILVIVDTPGKGEDYGSIVAAPYVKMILEDMLPYLSIMPYKNNESGLRTIEMPDVTGISTNEAKSILYKLGIDTIVLGYDGYIEAQAPQAGSYVSAGSTAILMLEAEDDAEASNKVSMPNLIGMSVFEANTLLTSEGLTIKLKNIGTIIVDQFPKEGYKCYIGDTVVLTLGYPENDS